MADITIGGISISTLYNSIVGSSVSGSAGYDSITNSGANATIYALSGADSIFSTKSDNVLMNGDDDGDFLVNGDYSVKGGNAVSMNGGAGNDTISNNGLTASINGNADADFILNGFSFYQFPDSILSDNKGEIYFYETDYDNVTGGDSSTIYGGAGNDTIVNLGISAIIKGEAGDDWIYDGYDYNEDFYGITISGDYATIDGGAGSDKIFSNGERASLVGGDSNDTIVSHGSTSTLNGGEGNDRIYNGYTYKSSENSISISTLEGFVSNYSEINGGAGNDTINNYGSNVTINGGTGDDAINVGLGKNNLIQLNEGDGNDTIYNFNETDSIKIGDGTAANYSSVISGNNLILSSGTDSITILNAGKLSTVNVEGQITDSETSLIGNSAQSIVTATNNIENLISFGRTKAIYIVGNARNNSIVGGTGIDTLDGKGGDDTLTGDAGNDTFIYSGGNDVITDYGTGGDNISLSGAEIKGIEMINDVDISDNDVLLSLTGGGSLTIKDGYKVKNNGKVTSKNKAITFLEEGTVTSKGKTTAGNILRSYVFEENKIFNSSKTEIILMAGATEFDGTEKDNSKIKTINASAVTVPISIQGNTSANKIYAGSASSTLNGGKGNDTLYGGAGEDVFAYGYNGGNDVIVDYAAGDKISLSGKKVEISNVSLKKTDVVFKVGSKKLTVKEASTTEITLDENGTTKFYNGGLLYDENKTSASVTAAYPTRTKLELSDANVNVIDAALATKAVNILGSSSADTILGSDKKDTLAGEDGADYLSGGKGNDSMKGGAGDDTLNGGKGSDLLWGDDGADTFIYAKGDGKDTIQGFDNNDMLQITGGKVDLYYTQRKEISVKVGSSTGAIILKNFGNTDTFHVNNETWILSDGVIKKS